MMTYCEKHDKLVWDFNPCPQCEQEKKPEMGLEHPDEDRHITPPEGGYHD